MDEPQGQGLWGLQGHQLQLRYLQGVTLIGPDERACAGVPWLQSKPLLLVGVHDSLHIFSREAVELG